MPAKLQAEGTDDLSDAMDDEQAKRGRVFMDDLRAAYNKAALSGLEPDDLAGILLCYAFATLQLTFDLSKPDLAGMIADSTMRYFARGAYEANRDSATVGTMQ